MQTGEFYRHSLEAEVYSAAPVELTRMLYNAAIESIERARMCLSGGDIEGRGRAISRASAILVELTTALDSNVNPELAKSLAELYDYIHRRILEAHVHPSDDLLAEASRLLRTLLEGWEACVSENTNGLAAEPSGPSGSVCSEPLAALETAYSGYGSPRY
jgi:flagellar protein FliS